MGQSFYRMKMIMALVTVIFMIITSYRVFKIVRFKNMLVLNLMVFSSLTMLLFLINFVDEICDLNINESWQKNYFNYSISALYSITLLINARLWLNHILKIEELVKKKDYEIARQRIDLGFYLIIVGKVIILVSECIINKVSDNYAFKKVFVSIYAFEFCIIGLLHLILGVLIERRLRNSFPQFHVNYKLYLNLITLCLSLPIILKGIVLLIFALTGGSPSTQKWVQDNNSWYAPFHYVIC